MAGIFQKNLIAALEDGAVDVDVNIAPGTADLVAADAMTEVIEADSEINEEAIAVEAYAFAIEQTMDNADQIEEVIETVEEVSGAEGGQAEVEGLTEGEAILAEEAFHQAFRKLGGDFSTTKYMASMESFRSSNSRAAATNLALESVIDKVKEVWASIIRAIKSLWKKLTALIKKFLDGNRKLEAAAKAMGEKVKKLRTALPKSLDEFENSGLSSAFPTEKKIDADAIRRYIAVHKAYVTSAESGVAALNELKKMVADASKNPTIDHVHSTADALSSDIAKYMLGGESASVKNQEDEQEFKSTKVLVDGKVVELRVVKNFSTAEDGAQDFSIAFEFTATENDDADGKVSPGSKSELSGLCNDIVILAKENAKFAATMDKQDKAAQGLISEVEKLVSGIESRDAAGDARKALNVVRKMVATSANKIGAFGGSLAGLNIRCGKAALRYVAVSASKY